MYGPHSAADIDVKFPNYHEGGEVKSAFLANHRSHDPVDEWAESASSALAKDSFPYKASID